MKWLYERGNHVIEQLKYTISEVSKILVPLDQTYFARLRLGK